jgi:hypothetical protein
MSDFTAKNKILNKMEKAWEYNTVDSESNKGVRRSQLFRGCVLYTEPVSARIEINSQPLSV